MWNAFFASFDNNFSMCKVLLMKKPVGTIQSHWSEENMSK